MGFGAGNGMGDVVSLDPFKAVGPSNSLNKPMKITLSLLGFIWFAFGAFPYGVEGQGLFTGGVDSTYSWTRQKSGGSVTQELSQYNSYFSNMTGYLYDRRLLNFDLSGNLSRDSSSHYSSGEEARDKSQSFSLGSSVSLLPGSRFPLSLYFSRGQSNNEADSSIASGSDSQSRVQSYGLNLSMREKGWLPQGLLSFSRNTSWQGGAESREELQDSWRFNLNKRREWRGNSLSLDYSLYRSNNRTADDISQSQGLSLSDSIRLPGGASLSLSAFLSRTEHENRGSEDRPGIEGSRFGDRPESGKNRSDTYGGGLSFSKFKSFDPTLSAGFGLNFYQQRSEDQESRNFSASASANKRKEFSSKLFLSASLSASLNHSDEDRSSNENFSLSLSSRNIPFVMTTFNYGLGMGQEKSGKGSLSNSLGLNLSTYAWQRLTLNGGFNLSLSSSEQDSTRMAYDFGLTTRPWRGLSWTSRVSLSDYETTRPLPRKGEKDRRGRTLQEEGDFVEEEGRPLLPLPESEPLPSRKPRDDRTRAFSWSNSGQLQLTYWINSYFSYDLYRSEERNNPRNTSQSSFRGGARLSPPYLPRVRLSVDFYQTQSEETGETRSGWRGTAQFSRGKTIFTLDTNFDDSETSSNNHVVQGIFLKIRRSVNSHLWR